MVKESRDNYTMIVRNSYILYLPLVYYQNVRYKQNSIQTMKYWIFYFDHSYVSKHDCYFIKISSEASYNGIMLIV